MSRPQICGLYKKPELYETRGQIQNYNALTSAFQIRIPHEFQNENIAQNMNKKFEKFCPEHLG